MRKNFEMTEEQLEKILEACQPVPVIMLQCGPVPSVQERANAAWAKLGEELGFDSMTVRPTGQGVQVLFGGGEGQSIGALR